MKFHKGEKVHGHYRSATWDGTVTGVVKKGNSEKTTEYKIKPLYRHVSQAGNKEPALIHRYGDKLKKGWVKAGLSPQKK